MLPSSCGWPEKLKIWTKHFFRFMNAKEKAKYSRIWTPKKLNVSVRKLGEIIEACPLEYTKICFFIMYLNRRFSSFWTLFQFNYSPFFINIFTLYVLQLYTIAVMITFSKKYVQLFQWGIFHWSSSIK